MTARDPPAAKELTHTPLVVLCAYLALALVLGGASREAFLPHLVLQTPAAAILLWRIVDRRFRPFPPALWLPLCGYLLIGAIAAAQLVPLPGEMWVALPGRTPIANGFEILGGPLPALPLSMTPGQTFEGLLGLLPPLAVLVLAGSLSWRRHGSAICWTLAALAIASVLLGAAQVLSGRDSALYFHAFTNWGLPVGFFANVNHQAVFLLIGALFLITLLARMIERHASQHESLAIAAPVGVALILVLFGVAMAGSVAGWMLTIPVMIFAFLSLFRTRALWARLSLVAAGSSAAVAMVALVMSSPLLADQGVGLSANSGNVTSRLEIASYTLEALAEIAPIGSGLGSFEATYPLYEGEVDLRRSVVNHTHNDYLEFTLEFGAAGALLIASFLLWLGWTTLRTWSGHTAEGQRLSRAATVGIWLLALHSLVDYPLRTPTMACVLALLIALTIKRSEAATPAATSESGTASRVAKHIEI